MKAILFILYLALIHPKHWGIIPVRSWTDLTLCSVWSLFRYLSSSCFFFSILLSRLVSSETTLLSMSLVFSTLSLIMDTKAWWQIQYHFTNENKPCGNLKKNEGCEKTYTPKPPWWQLVGPFQSHWSREVWQWHQFSFPVWIHWIWVFCITRTLIFHNYSEHDNIPIFRILYRSCKQHIPFGYSEYSLILIVAFSDLDMWDMQILFGFYEHSLNMYTAHSEYASRLAFLLQFATHGLLLVSGQLYVLPGHHNTRLGKRWMHKRKVCISSRKEEQTYF